MAKENSLLPEQKPEAEANERAGESLLASAWRSLRRNSTGMLGLIGFAAVVLIVLFAPILAPGDPTKMDFENILKGPSLTHPFGTDDLGRDTFTRVVWGGRESLQVALLADVISIFGGVLIGLISGFYGKWVDMLIMRIIDVLLAFPSILLVLSIVALLGPNLVTVLIALGISSIPVFARVVRGSVLSAKNFEYITAARVLGATNRYLMFSQILPNIMAPLIIYFTLGLGSGIMVTAGLSYIGLGAQPPSPEWGALLNAGRPYLQSAWWMSIFPGMAVFVSVLFINLLGDGLRDALDPKLRV